MNENEQNSNLSSTSACKMYAVYIYTIVNDVMSARVVRAFLLPFLSSSSLLLCIWGVACYKFLITELYLLCSIPSSCAFFLQNSTNFFLYRKKKHFFMCGAFKSINFSCSQMPFAKKCFADAIKRFSHDRIECVFLGRWVEVVLDGTEEKKNFCKWFFQTTRRRIYVCVYSVEMEWRWKIV